MEMALTSAGFEEGSDNDKNITIMQEIYNKLKIKVKFEDCIKSYFEASRHVWNEWSKRLISELNVGLANTGGAISARTMIN